MTKISDIVTDATEFIGEVAGASVQTYAEGPNTHHAIRAFDMIHSKYYWDEYMQWFQLTLDGITGRFTTNNVVDYVKDFGDFRAVRPTGMKRDIQFLSNMENPYSLGSGTGYPVRVASIPVTDANWQAKRLQFWPKTSTGTIDILARVYPAKVDATMDGESLVYLDRDLLVYATSLIVIALDDTNANALDVVKSMLENRFKDLTANRANQGVAVSGSNGIPTQWFEKY